MKVTIKGLKCRNCGDIIYSRAKHDFKHCSCEKIGIDGGPHIKDDNRSGYMRVKGYCDFKEAIIGSFESFNHARRVLHEDWNKGKNEYGLIKEEICDNK